MTRTPRVTDHLRDHIASLTRRVAAAGRRGRLLTLAAAGLAVAVLAAILVTTASAAGMARSAASTRGTGQHPAVAAAAAAATRASAPARASATARHDQHGHRAARPARHVGKTWTQVSRIAAGRTFPGAGHGPLPAADRLTPAGTSGPQATLPITHARWQNAKAIVRQALARHMGVRAAVVAVATAMQESGLIDLRYGTSDSLGLFQQRPSMGWGTPAQVLRPAYAANAFLGALRSYQASNPGWAHQPLWQTAQGVQKSGFPYAYAKWEAQAAHLVRALTIRLV